MRNNIYFIIISFIAISCNQTSDTNIIESAQSDTSSDSKNQQDLSTREFYKTDINYTINNISLTDTFNLNKYTEQLGQPDSIKLGGKEIIEEFGHDDYNVWYGENSLSAGHGYLLAAEIKAPGISLNGIQVGDKQTKIEAVYKIAGIAKDTIEVTNDNDDVVSFYLKNKKIIAIYFWRPL